MNQFANLTPEQHEANISNYLIEHLSYSAIRTFAGNEKVFEMKYIFHKWDKQRGLSAIIGDAYHHGLMEFFRHYQKTGKIMSFDKLSEVAHGKLDSIKANIYKPQKRKTIDEQKIAALKAVNALNTNFLKEVDAYLDDIHEIIIIEGTIVDFVTLEGVDIPIPIKIKPDIVYISKKMTLKGLDHKSKYQYTKEGDVNMDCSKQSITYTCVLESAMKRTDYKKLVKKYPKIKDGLEEFRFYENKYSQNKDGSRQIRCIKINLGKTRAMYEAILLESVHRITEAVSNPDYVYLMNQDDYFQDKAEVIDFWCQTRIEGLDSFPDLTTKQKRILKGRRLDINRSAISKVPKAVIKSFKEQTGFISFNSDDMKDKTNEEKIEHRLKCLSFEARVSHTISGYSCNIYLLDVGAGMKVASIFKYKMDMASALDVESVRIAEKLIQYQGRSYLSVEVNKHPKDRRALLLSNGEFPAGTKFALGRDNYDKEIVWDIGNHSTPHLLVAGATGSGKSVAIKTIVDQAVAKGYDVTLIDPKYEFVDYSDSCNVISEQSDVERTMAKLVVEMDSAYKAGVKETTHKKMIIFDEASDCFTRQRRPERGEDFRTLEQNTLLLAQKARAAGIHMVLSSQRWSVKVMTGDAKANFATRLCLTVASEVDSKVMLDEIGAEDLNGSGDALYRSPDTGESVRIQCYMIK